MTYAYAIQSNSLNEWNPLKLPNSKTILLLDVSQVSAMFVYINESVKLTYYVNLTAFLDMWSLEIMWIKFMSVLDPNCRVETYRVPVIIG